ncbi:hypothetical protein HDU83_006149 [Entophlyctis luteolus]|nr:hypothetical protein HDU83_006149 [Entophlyctis luteolus]
MSAAASSRQTCLELAQLIAPSRPVRERGASMRRLVQLLSAESTSSTTGSQPAADIRPIDVVLADCVPSLLHAAQLPVRSASSLAPDPARTPQTVIDLADDALVALGLLCTAGTQLLEQHGWHVDDDGTGRGRPIYINPSTGESQPTPPDLGSAAHDLLDDPSDAWALALLFELSTISSPYANPVDGSLCWCSRQPARIRFHEPETNEYTPTANNLPLPRKLAMTVVDVAQDDDDDEEDDDDNGENGDSRLLAFTRHLVLGPWHGIPSFRETEVDLDHPPPGSHLEAWYTCAMACMQFLAARKAGRAKVLLVGLGGGALASFSARHWPGMRVEAVELDSRVVRVAERWFGVKCEPSQLTDVDGVLGDGFDEPKHFVADDGDTGDDGPAEPLRPTHVRITSAEAFVAGAVRDPECRYDVILVDVYTRGGFPESLATAEFFGGLKKLLKTNASDDFDGTLVVNAGVGATRERIEALVRGCMPVVKVLVDAHMPATVTEEDSENAVVVGMQLRPGGGQAVEEGTVDISPREWAARARVVRETWPHAPLPPFELHSAVHGPNGEVMIAWAANSMLGGRDATGNSDDDDSKPAASDARRKEVSMMDKNDDAFGLFD